MVLSLFKWLLSGFLSLFGISSSNMEATNICGLPPEQGPCRAIMTRYYYDPLTGNCAGFMYGGCAGNKNNFYTLEECVQTCGGLANSNIQPYLPPQPSQYLLGVENYARSGESMCNFPPDAGRCRAAMIRYYYDRSNNKCSTFIYGGCGGNGNNFQSLQGCTQACAGRGNSLPNQDQPLYSLEHIQFQDQLGPYGSKPDICFLPSDSGHCRAIMESFYYNSATGVCEEFTYGGCGGNKNRFLTLEECTAHCMH